MSLDRAAKAQRTIAAMTNVRNREIRKARRGGASLRAIAEVVGLSHTMVAKICAAELD